MRAPKTSIPTIYDVAHLAGVSIATVSRVLNSPEQVSDAARERVMAAIDQLGFVPKAEARARALQHVGRIGVITPFFTAPSFVQRLRGMATALSNTSYELVIYTVDSLARKKSFLATLPLARSLDGLVIMSLTLDDSDAARLQDHGLETVLIEYPKQNFSGVIIDDLEGGRMAAEYLLKKGHRRCAFMGDTDLPEYSVHPISQRLYGFRRALVEAGATLPDDYVLLAPYSLEQSRKQALCLLNLPQRPTAIFVATDLQAMGVLKASRDLGLKVPEDLAILGFDDLDMADYVGLTTVRQPLDESGRIAVELLLSRMADPTRPHQHVLLPLSIVERETV